MIAVLLFLNAALTVFLIFLSFQEQPVASQPPSPPEPLNAINHDLLVTLLLPHAEAAVLGYYQNMNGYGVSIAPETMEIIALERKGHVQAFSFEVQVKIISFVAGLHRLGEDVLTFEINNGRIKLTAFKHLQKFPLPGSNLTHM